MTLRPSIVALVARRLFKERTSGGGYWLGVGLSLVIIVGAFAAPTLQEALENTGGTTVAVVADQETTRALQGALGEELPDGRRATTLERVATERAARADLDAGRVDAVATVTSSGGSIERIGLRAERVPDDLRAAMQEAGATVAATQRLDREGVSASAALAPVPVAATNTNGDAPDASERAAAYVLTFVLYFSLITFAMAVGTALVSEKQNRVTEMVLTAVRPAEHLTGTLLGIGLAGLLQYVIWIAVAAVGLGVQALIGGGSLDLADVGPATLVAFLLAYVLAYSGAAALNAATTSGLSKAEDAQSAQTPVILLLVVGFVLAIQALGDPNGGAAVYGSLVPVAGPMVLFVRVALGEPTVLEIAAGLGASLVVTVLLLTFAARVHRSGVHRYGGKMDWRGLLRMAR